MPLRKNKPNQAGPPVSGILQPKETIDMIVEITDVAFGGSGVGTLEDGRVVFVPFTAPGDTAEIAISRDHGRYAEAELMALRVPGPGRVEPLCPYYGRCGGCQYQHLAYDLQVELKQKQLRDVLQRIGRLSDLPEISPVAASPKPYAYRNKLALEPVREPESPEKRLDYGFCERDNKTFFAVESCPLATPELNQLLAKIGRTTPGRRNAAAEAPRKLVLRQQADGSTHFYFGRASFHATWLEENVLNQKVRVPLGSFWQVNPDVAADLFETVRQWGRDAAGQCMIDAYGGAGAFSLAMGDAFKQHIVIESDEQAVRAAVFNHGSWGIAKARCLRGKTEQRLPKLLQEMKPASRQATTVLLDPPRTGCRDQVLEALLKQPVGNLIYVSCNPSTLARDLRQLCQEGAYRVQKLALFDMFPQTSHFETAVGLVWSPKVG